MNSTFIAEARKGHAAMRGVSQGAGITLCVGSGGFTARFECAQRCALVLGDRDLIPGDYPAFSIPNEDAFRALTKLSESFSVALVDTVTDEQGTRFVLLWRIAARSEGETVPSVEPDPNQGNLDLDEY